MAVDDTWHLSKRGPNGERVKSKKYGRGKRWRVRYQDAAGEPRERLFERKTDAEDWDARTRSGTEVENSATRAGQVTFREYAERWRLSRETGWSMETRKRIPGNLRDHLYPTFGNRRMSAITLTDVLEWLSTRVAAGTPKTSLKLYFELMKTVMRAAMIDKVRRDNPCDGVKLSQALRGLSRVPKWVPTEDQVLALLDVVPARYKAMIWLGAGQGLRIGEAFAIEAGARCLDFERGELHVVQQLQQSSEYGGFYLAPPKSGSVGTVELDPSVGEQLAAHMSSFPPIDTKLTDITRGDPEVRTASLLFTSAWKRPLTYKKWSLMWAQWRKAAGWPLEGTFHSLRHFFATTLLANGVDPQQVQKALRHATVKITLETYIHWLPKKDRPRGVIGVALAKARSNQPARERAGQDHG